MFKGNSVKNGNCPATVMGAKAHKSHCPDLSGWEGGRVEGPESGDPGYPERSQPFERKGGFNETRYELKLEQDKFGIINY